MTWIKLKWFDTVKTAGEEIPTLWQLDKGELKFKVKWYASKKEFLFLNFHA